MLKISDFANMVGVSEQTLKFYERKGLFFPARINEQTGYRYYNPVQLKEFERISELKFLGMSLKDIKEMISGKYSLDMQLNNLYARRDMINNIIKALEILKTSEL